MPANLIAAAVVAAGLIIAAMFGRYEIASFSAQPATVARLDRLTGKVETCVLALADVENGGQPKWCHPGLLPR